MSVEQVKAAAEKSKDTYLSLPANVLQKALKECPCDPELSAHVDNMVKNAEDASRALNLPMEKTIYPSVSVHREKHLGKLLGIPALPLET